MKNKISQELVKIFKTKIKFDSLYLHEPDLNKGDANYLKDCIITNTVSQGKYVDKFESEISKFTGAKYVVTTNSGTSALHVSCLLMGIKEQDEVLVPAFTFVAVANAIKYWHKY